MMRFLPMCLPICSVAMAVAMLSACATSTEKSVVDSESNRAAQWLAENRDSPPRLRAFLNQMPKGGDIHTHLSGAVYAESYLQWAASESLCVNPESGAIAANDREPCQLASHIPVAKALKTPLLYASLVNKMSLRNFDYTHQRGHDQFFQAFAKFAGGNKGQMISELSNRAARQNIAYLEIMVSLGKEYTKQLGNQIGFDGNLEATYQKLMNTDMRSSVVVGQQELNRFEWEGQSHMDCPSSLPQAGCAVERRYLLQISRTNEPARVFAEMVYAFEIAQVDPLAIGLNLVAPEDDMVALRDYDLHMQMLQFLSTRYPTVPIALHAGELTLGLVPPENLRDHIRKAVEIAGAKRIGHGVDVMYEEKPFQLLQRMKEKKVLVEICLTSNDAILGVKGKYHPFSEYLKAGVPVTLASDDEGVSRIDLTHEYQRATQDYGLDYSALKTLARNSIHYSFLKGNSLWKDSSYRQTRVCNDADFPIAGEACQRFLNTHDKARVEWKLEKQFKVFEQGGWQ